MFFLPLIAKLSRNVDKLEIVLFFQIRLGNRTPIVRLSLIEYGDSIKKIGLIGFG